MRYIFLLTVIAILTSCGNTYFIVRHAEKAPAENSQMQGSAVPNNDPPLSDAGKQRAVELKEFLRDKNVNFIFSTNYKRTISTAGPLNESRGSTTIELYSPSKDSLASFIAKLKSIRKGNVLVVGHSNTVDDIANALSGSAVVPGDLKDSQYDNLFVVKRKGKRYTFTGKKYGVRTE